MDTLQDQLFIYAKRKYKVEPEHLWVRYPNYAVLRHKDNEKWFALFMDVPGRKLGLDTDEVVEILDLKMGDPLLADLLIQQDGFLRGYHISRGNWISILLDGTVPFDDICHWLHESYLTTASKATQQMCRPPKEWIVPANPKYFDIQAAFDNSPEISWKQGKGIKAGDNVYFYVAAPVSAILFKCKVTRTDIPYSFSNGQVHMNSLMKVKLQKRYKPDQFPFETLEKEYGIFAVRGPRGIPDSLSKALK